MANGLLDGKVALVTGAGSPIGMGRRRGHKWTPQTLKEVQRS